METRQAPVKTCGHCSTSYTLPEGRASVTEFTADGRPPARVTVWAAAPEARIPDFENDEVVHQCRKGRPACVRCGAIGQVGNALLGHPPEPLICLACAKAQQLAHG